MGGEGFWSKAQKDAVYHLIRYARNSDPVEYTLFRKNLTVPLGDREARLQLERAKPDPWRVKVGFLLGRNHPEDIDRMATFFRRFRNVSFVDQAIGIWAQGDSLIGELASVGSQINAEIVSGQPDHARLEGFLVEVDTLSGELTQLEDAFSRTMGDGARWAARVVFAAIVTAAVLLVALAVFVTWRMHQRLRESEESLRASEAQLRQAQKMEAVGQLTGGIAHDFNNLLTVILSTAELIEAELPPHATEARTDLSDLKHAAERGAEMIRKLLAFSRSGQLQFKSYDLSQLVVESVQMLRRVLPSHVEVLVDADHAVHPINTDPAVLEQILLNLATNSRDAMPEGGTLRLAIDLVRLDQRHVSRLGWGRAGTYTALQLRDSGLGMEQAVRERIFEPFFTTKPPGQGTGLGMAMVYGLMKQHGGFVEVHSTLGIGTTVTLYFPPALEEPGPSPHLPVTAPAGSETILLVEDEAALRRSAMRILERKGYRVLTAADGEEALHMFRMHQDRVALVLSDVVMPRLSGPGLYSALRREGAQVPFLFMSGYTERDRSTGMQMPQGVPLLQKPWVAGDLLHVIQELLSHRAPS
ncbi:MAG TPA: ATP-binding protein [Gemmatimonadales bacterium]|nr:ATP-binding protein [Gemmatimonadales bacterium]